MGGVYQGLGLSPVSPGESMEALVGNGKLREGGENRGRRGGKNGRMGGKGRGGWERHKDVSLSPSLLKFQIKLCLRL